MELSDGVATLAALAQGARLAVFRLLVRAGSEGLPAGEISRRLGMRAPTASFHLNLLSRAGLISCTREGRSLLYALRPERLRELLWFLGEECCQGRAALCPAPATRIHARLKEARGGEAQATVLFVCSRNSARSQMAEAILRHEAGDRVRARSAGIRPEAIHPLALRVLREEGLPTEGLEPKDLGDLLGKVAIHCAIVVCEAANAHCPAIVPFAPKVLYWPFPDPAEAKQRKLEVFREVRDGIGRKIRRWLREEFPALERARARKGA